MQIKLTTLALLFFIFSCNTADEKDSKPTNTSTEVSTDDDDAKPANDIAAQKSELNKQSKACIALMNALEVEQKAAFDAGNAEAARALGARIDSAARENVKIGQQLIALDK